MSTALRVTGFDFHCHIDLFPDPAALVEECDKERILLLAVTTTPLAWTQNRRWAADSQYVHAAVGLHPELVGERHHEIEQLEKILAESPFIGEIGLDGSPKYRESWETQKQVFARTLSAAQRLGGRVASIHSRRATVEVLRCIGEHTTADRVLPILHWFSGAGSLAEQALSLGCYFSVNHHMLVSPSGLKLVRSLPLDRLLTETDAPFTAVNGRKSAPPDVTATAARLASTRDVSSQEMRRILSTNARTVFAFAGIDVSFERDESS